MDESSLSWLSHFRKLAFHHGIRSSRYIFLSRGIGKNVVQMFSFSCRDSTFETRLSIIRISFEKKQKNYTFLDIIESDIFQSSRPENLRVT